METEEQEAQRITRKLPLELQKRLIKSQYAWRSAILKQLTPQQNLGFAIQSLLELCRMLADDPTSKFAESYVTQAKNWLKRSRSELAPADDVTKVIESFRVVIEVVAAMEKRGVN